jgi:hypothetical protein
MDSEETTWVAASKEETKAKLFRKWAFTINCELLKDERLNSQSFYVEGHNLSETTNKRNKVVRTTVWIGALEPPEEGKKDPYWHRHCAIESTGGGISKMNALTLMSTYLNIPIGTLTCGHGNVVSYSQPVKSWLDYQKYMFKILPGRMTSDEEKIQQSVIKLRRNLRKNPTPTQVKEYLLRENLLSFRKVATGAIKAQIELACEVGDMYKSDDSGGSSPDNDDGQKFLNKLARMDSSSACAEPQSSSFFDDVLEVLVKQLRSTTRDGQCPPLRGIFEIIALLIMPLFLKRNNNDHKTKSLVLFGRSKTGKSFIPMQLVKANKLHLVSSDAKGVGRFDANTAANGFFFDDVKNNLLMSTDAPTIKNLTAGDEASIKIYSKSTTVRGWTIITCQQKLLRQEVDTDAWKRRLIELNFNACEPIHEYTTVFDILKRSNVDEMLTFLYYVIHKPKSSANVVLKDFLIQSEYYDEIVCKMFDKLKEGSNLLRLLNMNIVNIEKTFDVADL